MSDSYLFTSESVYEGHPDKVADQISDAVLDAMLAQDKRARVACETLVKTGVAIVAGEVTTEAWVDLEELVRGVIVDIGYTSSQVGFDGRTCGVMNIIVTARTINIDVAYAFSGTKRKRILDVCSPTATLNARMAAVTRGHPTGQNKKARARRISANSTRTRAW